MDNKDGLRPIGNLVCKTFLARETYIPYDDGGPKRPGWAGARKNLIVTFGSGDKLKFIHNEDNNTGCIVMHEKKNKRVRYIFLSWWHIFSVKASKGMTFFIPGFCL